MYFRAVNVQRLHRSVSPQQPARTRSSESQGAKSEDCRNGMCIPAGYIRASDREG